MKRACACAGEEGSERRGFWGRLGASAKLLWYEICVLHRHPVFLANIWAYVPVQAVLGALTFWGPKARAGLVQVCLLPFQAFRPCPGVWVTSATQPACVPALRRCSVVCDPGLHAVDTAGRHAAQAALAVLRESGDTMDMVMGSMTVGGAIVGTLGGGARLAVTMP